MKSTKDSIIAGSKRDKSMVTGTTVTVGPNTIFRQRNQIHTKFDSISTTMHKCMYTRHGNSAINSSYDAIELMNLQIVIKQKPIKKR